MWQILIFSGRPTPTSGIDVWLGSFPLPFQGIWDPFNRRYNRNPLGSRFVHFPGDSFRASQNLAHDDSFDQSTTSSCIGLHSFLRLSVSTPNHRNSEKIRGYMFTYTKYLEVSLFE